MTENEGADYLSLVGMSFATPWSAAHQAPPFFTSGLCSKFISTESVMLSNYLILCCSLLFLPSIFPSIRVFSSESALRIRWPKYWCKTASNPRFPNLLLKEPPLHLELSVGVPGMTENMTTQAFEHLLPRQQLDPGSMSCLPGNHSLSTARWTGFQTRIHDFLSCVAGAGRELLEEKLIRLQLQMRDLLNQVSVNLLNFPQPSHCVQSIL